MNIFEPDNLAAQFREDIKHELTTHQLAINVVGFLASHDKASEIYAQYTQTGCESVGINFKLIQSHPESIGSLMNAANNDPSIHGILVYYPIFGDVRDTQLRNQVAWTKDVEGLTSYWLNKLYANIRFDNAEQTHKAILPCTSLAIIKILEKFRIHNTTGLTFHGCTISIFNRSEVVGKPLAFMLSHDGATVYSFDIYGGVIIDKGAVNELPISRDAALPKSDIVITGVPSRHFHKIRTSELKADAICLNFAHVQNFTAEAKEQARYYIPRIGTLTVAMCLRNAVRLYRNYHSVNK